MCFKSAATNAFTTLEPLESCDRYDEKTQSIQLYEDNEADDPNERKAETRVELRRCGEYTLPNVTNIQIPPGTTHIQDKA